MKITVDFDGTLAKPKVQKFISKLIGKGVSISIVTSRYGHVYAARNSFVRQTHDDLYSVSETMGIQKENVYFTNGKTKNMLLKKLRPVLHIDNNSLEINIINQDTNTTAINVGTPDWEREVEYILGI